MNDKEFQSLVTWDLDTYKEFSKGAISIMRHRMIIEVIGIFYLIAFMLAMGVMRMDMDFFSVAIIFLIVWGVVKFVTRKGDLQYKRMLSNNNGQPPRNQIIISGEGIQTQNLDNGNATNFEFQRILSIMETKNLLILMMEYRQGLVIDKRTLTGGTSEELAACLLSICTNLKKRKINSGRGSKIRKRIFLLLFVIDCAFALTLKITDDRETPDNNYEEMYDLSSGKMNTLPYKEIAGVYEALGIEGISEEQIVQLEHEWKQMSEEEREYLDKDAMLLTEIGCGTYDETTWAWIPSSADVYAFDMEFLNIESMYTELMISCSWDTLSESCVIDKCYNR